jgi:poly(3-hydroxyalkanoate) synthetase
MAEKNLFYLNLKSFNDDNDNDNKIFFIQRHHNHNGIRLRGDHCIMILMMMMIMMVMMMMKFIALLTSSVDFATAFPLTAVVDPRVIESQHAGIGNDRLSDR